MNKQIDITFIVPVYNTAEYLAECLDSILIQDISKEVLVINDGSTDNSAEILAVYAKQYSEVRVINQANKGVSAARNLGIKQARGEFIWFLDSDDKLFSQIGWSEYITYLRDHNDCSLIKFTVYENKTNCFLSSVSDEVNKVILEIYLKKRAGMHETIRITTSDYLFESIKRANYAFFCVPFLYRTAFLRKNNLYFSELISHAEDTVFMAQVLSCDPQTYLIETSETAYFYRYRQNSATQNKDNEQEKIEMHFKAQQILLHYIICNSSKFNHYPMLKRMLFIMALKNSSCIFESYSEFMPETKTFLRKFLTIENYVNYSFLSEIALREFNQHFFGREKTFELFERYLNVQ
ncbi:glycosyltransferase [Pasteurellaceae bacterium LIM206]|nr:glycosyltransferase [Pasteurellaceae bacterium LIM206]